MQQVLSPRHLLCPGHRIGIFFILSNYATKRFVKKVQHHASAGMCFKEMVVGSNRSVIHGNRNLSSVLSAMCRGQKYTDSTEEWQ